MLALAKARALTVAQPVELNDALVKQLAYTSSGSLPPMCSVIGGIVAQEVLTVRSRAARWLHRTWQRAYL